MTFICCVPGCGETGKRIFHSFPKNELQCRNWIVATKCFYLNTKSAWNSHRKICRKHFKKSDLRNWNLLKKGVEPSRMLPHTIIMEHDYCRKNLIHMHEDEEIENQNLDNEDEGSKCNDIGGVCVLKAEKMEVVEDQQVVENQKVVEVEKKGNQADDVGEVFVLQYDTTEFLDSSKNSVYHQKPLTPQNLNVDCVDHENSTSKSSRTYDPMARRMRYLEKRNKFLAKKLKEIQFTGPKSNKKSKVKKQIDNVLKTLSTTLPPEQFNFVKLQIRNAGKRKQGYRFSFDEKTLALAIYKQNPKRYDFLCKRACLPTRQTLITHSAAIRFTEGINPKLFDFIKEAVSKMEEMDKMCTIGWDEMSLTAHIDFERVKDYIDGFEDLGSKRTNNFATHALVFMIRGLNSAYKQPIAYFLTENIDSAELAELTTLIIKAVLDTGLVIIGSVCDAVSTNIAAVNKLINPQCLRGNTGGTLLEYTINGSKIIHYFDPPHLIKSVRNNLLVKDVKHCVSFNETKFKPSGTIVWNEKNKVQRLASWTDVKDFYDFNNNPKNGLFNLIPNITDEHMNPDRRKMKVKLATQVFSGTYGRNMYLCAKRNQLPNNKCGGTAALLMFFNDVFDSVNGGGIIDPGKLTGSINPESKHFKFWDYAIRMLDTMTFTENLKTGNASKTNVFKHFITTLKGMRELSERLFKLGLKSVSLRRANQDGLENHFSIIRSLCGANTKPNARDFRIAYSTSLLINLLTDHSINANCEADEDDPLIQNLRILFKVEPTTGNSISNDSNCSFEADGGKPSHLQVVNQAFVSMLDDETDFSNIIFPENESLNCISGQVCKKLLKKTKCISCADTVKAKGKCVEHDIIRKQSSDDETVLPNVDFIKNIKNIILKTQKMIPIMCAERKILQKMLSGLTIENNNNKSIGCELHRNELITETKKITVKVTIEKFCQQINKILSGKVTVATEDLIQKKALEFRMKKKHIGKFVPRNND